MVEHLLWEGRNSRDQVIARLCPTGPAQFPNQFRNAGDVALHFECGSGPVFRGPVARFPVSLVGSDRSPKTDKLTCAVSKASNVAGERGDLLDVLLGGLRLRRPLCSESGYVHPGMAVSQVYPGLEYTYPCTG